MVALAPRQEPEGIGIEAAKPTDGLSELALGADRCLQAGYIEPPRTSLPNTLFCSEVAGCSFVGSGILDSFDVINLHWLPGLLGVHDLEEIVALGKAVLLTLRDMAAFTGGCHYSAGCTGYRESGAPCRQFGADVLGLAAWTQGEKRRTLNAAQVVAVAPSQWLAGCA